MRTCAELRAWIEGAAAELGDPAEAVGQAFFRWSDNWQAEGADLSAGMHKGELVLMLGRGAVIPIQLRAGDPELAEDGVVAFSTTQITAGVWAVSPSLNVPGLVHVFVVLYDVPAPAPWERKIILARELVG
jgi:hypothetical protein